LISHQKPVFCHASQLNKYSLGLEERMGRDVYWMDGRASPPGTPTDRNPALFVPRGTKARETHLYISKKVKRNS